MIFIGGLQRSGTTLLGRLVASHPKISGLVGTPTAEDEGQFVQSVYLDDHQMGRPDGKRPARANRWAYHHEAHLTEMDIASRQPVAERLLASWEPYLEKRRAPYLVEKSPSNLTRMRFLQAAFPGSHFIVITRHPITQALAVRKWAHASARVGVDLGQLVHHWLTAMEIFREDEPSIHQLKVVRYEHLVRDPRRILDEIWEFIGIEGAAVDTSSISDRDSHYRDYWRWMNGAPGQDFHPLNRGSDTKSRIVRAGERLVMPVLRGGVSSGVKRKYSTQIASFGYDPMQLETVPDWVPSTSRGCA
jgi:hypothetical protein